MEHTIKQNDGLKLICSCGWEYVPPSEMEHEADRIKFSEKSHGAHRAREQELEELYFKKETGGIGE